MYLKRKLVSFLLGYNFFREVFLEMLLLFSFLLGLVVFWVVVVELMVFFIWNCYFYGRLRDVVVVRGMGN